MSRLIRLCLVVAAAVASVTLGAIAPATAATSQPAQTRDAITWHVRPAVAAPAAGSSWYHCPYGAVCIYPEGKNPTTNSGVYPESNGIFYSYGYHNLSNQYNNHYIVDNQYGSAWDFECSGYNGTGKVLGNGPHHSAGWENLTPVNSVVLRSSFDNGGVGSACP